MDVTNSSGPGSSSIRVGPRLAIQPRVGLLSERRGGHDSLDSDRADVVGIHPHIGMWK